MSEQEEKSEDMKTGEEVPETETEETAEEAGEAQEASEEESPEEAENAQEPETKEETGSQEKAPEKSGRIPFFKKKKDKKDEKIDELNDQLLRQMAEFDNFRKRTEKEKSVQFERGARTVIEKFLPIVDSFERGLAMKPEDENTPFTDGMEKVYKQLLAGLEALEVTPIEAVGQPFDPAFHNAVMQDEEADAPENTVVAEFQKGYLYRGSVIRYSMVKVRK